MRAILSDNAGCIKKILINHGEITAKMIMKQAYKTCGNYQANYATPVPNDQDLQALDPATNAEQRAPFFCQAVE